MVLMITVLTPVFSEPAAMDLSRCKLRGGRNVCSWEVKKKKE